MGKDSKQGLRTWHSQVMEPTGLAAILTLVTCAEVASRTLLEERCASAPCTICSTAEDRSRRENMAPLYPKNAKGRQGLVLPGGYP